MIVKIEDNPLVSFREMNDYSLYLDTRSDSPDRICIRACNTLITISNMNWHYQPSDSPHMMGKENGALERRFLKLPKGQVVTLIQE